jgi:hypothetical protein
LLRRLALHGFNASQPRAGSLASGVYRAGEQYPLAEAELLDKGSGNVRVGLLGDVVTSGVAKKAVTLGVHFEHALGALVVAGHKFLKRLTTNHTNHTNKTKNALLWIRVIRVIRG